MSKSEKITERRETIKRLVVRGLNNSEIGRKLNVSETQIRRDLKFIQEKTRVDIKRINLEDLMGLLKNQTEEVLREAWIMYKDSSEKGKLQSLRIILEGTDKQFRAMSGLGITADQIGFQQNIQQNISITQILQEIKNEKDSIDIKK